MEQKNNGMFPAVDFSRTEFACRCGCGADTVDAELLEVLQRLRRHFREAVRIHCGIRCPGHNARVGGAPDSQHLTGKAADFHVDGVDHSRVIAYLDTTYPVSYGMSAYPWGIHLDVRKDRARW